MREHDPSEERLPAIGRPPRGRDPKPQPNSNADFSEEHDAVAVSGEVITDEPEDREPESPHGWSGLES